MNFGTDPLPHAHISKDGSLFVSRPLYNAAVPQGPRCTALEGTLPLVPILAVEGFEVLLPLSEEGQGYRPCNQKVRSTEEEEEEEVAAAQQEPLPPPLVKEAGSRSFLSCPDSVSAAATYSGTALPLLPHRLRV